MAPEAEDDDGIDEELPAAAAPPLALSSAEASVASAADDPLSCAAAATDNDCLRLTDLSRKRSCHKCQSTAESENCKKWLVKKSRSLGVLLRWQQWQQPI